MHVTYNQAAAIQVFPGQESPWARSFTFVRNPSEPHKAVLFQDRGLEGVGPSPLGEMSTLVLRSNGLSQETLASKEFQKTRKLVTQSSLASLIALAAGQDLGRTLQLADFPGFSKWELYHRPDRIDLTLPQRRIDDIRVAGFQIITEGPKEYRKVAITSSEVVATFAPRDEALLTWACDDLDRNAGVDVAHFLLGEFGFVGSHISVNGLMQNRLAGLRIQESDGQHTVLPMATR